MVRLAILLALLLLTAAPRVVAAAPPVPTGSWLTQDGDAVIEIARCGDALCGRIAGIRLDHPGDPMPVDWRGNSQCGLTILADARAEGDGWFGRITDPSNGSVWHVRLAVGSDGRLRLRGYIGIPLLGETQIWQPYTGALPPDCRLLGSSPASPGRQTPAGSG
jgi:uncharacterized protein (DUF2147 family)